MLKRTRLSDRRLPAYTKGEEIMNMVTHIVGGGLGVTVLLLCLTRAIRLDSADAVIGAAVYGVTMITLYAVSSVYHGMRRNTGKKVMQIIDHCAIYFLIAGTYTPILLIGFIPRYPQIGWSLLALEWILAIAATVLTAIDLHNYRIVSMVCYITMGWGILPFCKQTMELMTKTGFGLLLSGGIVYTVGAILYGIGSKKRWWHSVFHIFVVAGSLLQFLAIFIYIL